MSSQPNSLAILAAAGSRKTEFIIDSALAVREGSVLITTYTNENQRQIVRRIEKKLGFVPPNITVTGWFSFLIAQCAKPYQRALTQTHLTINGLNFKGTRNRYTPKSSLTYFLDSSGDMYRDGVSDFVVTLDREVKGAVVRRLEKIYTHIFIDEVQDLVGYDLEVLDLLINSKINVVLVGDPRQHTLSTNIGSKNKQYRGAGLATWLAKRQKRLRIEERTESYRCCQAICDFADAIYPHLPATVSRDVPETDHCGIIQVLLSEVEEYAARYAPLTALRHDKNSDTIGLSAINIGISKGSTFDRVIIFPTKPMLQFLKDRDSHKLKSPERLYVAVTRARFSVAFAVPVVQCSSIALYRPKG